MELTSEITRNKRNSIIDNKKILDSIRNLDINGNIKICTKDDFLLKIESEWLFPMKQLINILFNVKYDDDMAKGVLHAYYLTGYRKDIFTVFYTTNFDERILNYSDKTVDVIDSIITHKSYSDQDLDIIDHYYSLYKIWSSRELLQDIDEEILVLDDVIETYFLLMQMNKSSKVRNQEIIQLTKTIDNIFQMHNMLGLKSLFKYYKQIKHIPEIKKYFWNKVKTLNNNDMDHIITILISEIRNTLIPNTQNVNDRKILYFDIDIDDIISKIRCSEINHNDYYPIVKLLVHYTSIIYKKRIMIINPQHKNDIFNNIINIMDALE